MNKPQYIKLKCPTQTKQEHLNIFLLLLKPLCRLFLLIEKSIELELSDPTCIGRKCQRGGRAAAKSILRYCLI